MISKQGGLCSQNAFYICKGKKKIGWVFYNTVSFVVTINIPNLTQKVYKILLFGRTQRSNAQAYYHVMQGGTGLGYRPTLIHPPLRPVVPDRNPTAWEVDRIRYIAGPTLDLPLWSSDLLGPVSILPLPLDLSPNLRFWL